MSVVSIVIMVCCGIVAYLLGSIPTAVWVGKRFHGIDVREHGSGNAGTTNVLRVLGTRAALPVLLIDVLKGFLAVLLAYLIPDVERGTETFGIIKIGCGLLAVVGHMYPIFAGFKGGKGVATMLGIAMAIQPPATLVGVGVFIVVFLITRIVSVSSMSAGLSFPIAVIFIFKENMLSFQIFSILVYLLLLYTHRRNIQRLLNGTEPRTVFKKKGS
ncbi:MAG: glycerol-3-phosphate 1-O-acyltransferase PlsY [Prevotellaceae bacterium]|jgi:glycerol-3-phosphate acyltransferase PlsY|nr:glycerol-3-phosphate 1-O-acyltransferase PlsY [Prevotellaceae bacterium]